MFRTFLYIRFRLAVPTESLPTPSILSTIRFSELYLKPLDENQKSFVVLVVV